MSIFKTVAELTLASLKGAESRIERGLSFLGFIEAAKGTLDKIPESVTEEVDAACKARYLKLHTTPMGITVKAEGEGTAKTYKASRLSDGEHQIIVKDAMDADLKEMEPARKAAYVLVRRRFSDYKRQALGQLVSAAKDAIKVQEDGAGAAKVQKTFRQLADKQLTMLLDRATKKAGKDATIPDKYKASITVANAAWIKEVFGK